MMEVFWTMLASQDRKRIREYIAEQNLMAAIELDERIGYSASSLAGQPYKGRNGRVEGTRELVIHPHFVLVYEVDSQWGKVYILRVCNGLASKVQNVLKDDPFSGHLFIFRGRRGDQIKVLWADSDGLCLFTKRLERGRFVWPVTRDGKVHLTPAQLSMLLEGIDWKHPKRTERAGIRI
ncbi:IS66 family insertion sequence element accessory protein TnpB [Escherichia coli]|nr:IS66 family insertion sequence element accessory protein TnpB [Escherichia coli]